MRQVRIGGVSASMYFLAVDRLIPNSRAIPRMDMPLRFAFCIALHRAFSSNVGFRGGMTATFAEFEADLSRMRTREGMAIARANGKLRGKQPKLSDRQQRELHRMHATGEYSISDLAELFSVSRPTAYRTLNRRLSP